jgi:hypothetical protein
VKEKGGKIKEKILIKPAKKCNKEIIQTKRVDTE